MTPSQFLVALRRGRVEWLLALVAAAYVAIYLVFYDVAWYGVVVAPLWAGFAGYGAAALWEA
jgi:hypothetical protein